MQETQWLGGAINYHMGVDGISMLFVIAGTCASTCSVGSQNDCDVLGGTFQGAGTTCDIDPCNP